MGGTSCLVRLFRVVFLVLVATGSVHASDCNRNGVEDATDIANGTSLDCNSNGVPDSCDVSSSIGFLSAIPYEIKEGASCVALADLNGDGLVDIAVGTDVVISVFLGAGGTNFVPGGDFNASNGNSPRSIKIADLDKDGDLDLAVAAGFAATTLLNDGAGNLGAPRIFLEGFGAFDLGIADLDSDGDDDIVTANFVMNSVSIVRNDGGIFAATESLDVGQRPVSLFLGDIDSDGKLDIEVGCGDGLYQLLGLGSGTFGPSSRILAGSDFYFLAGGDLSGDGHPEVVASTSFSNGLFVLAKDGSDVLSPMAQYPVRGGRPLLADLDGDLDLDVALTDGQDAFWVLFNEGGGLSVPVGYTAGPVPVYGAAGDVDGDGDVDLVTVNRPNGSTNQVAILLNDGHGGFDAPRSTPTPPIPQHFALQDLNGDAAADLIVLSRDPDLLVLLNQRGALNESSRLMDAFGPRAIAVTDLDGDGDADLGVANNTAEVSVFINEGLGSFVDTGGFELEPRQSVIVAGDLDGDGDTDLCLGFDSRTQVRAAINGGGASFAPGPALDVGGVPQALVVADLNGDGLSDLVAACDSSSGILSVLLQGEGGTFAAAKGTVLEGRPTGVAVGDADRDGDLDVGVVEPLPEVVEFLQNDGKGNLAVLRKVLAEREPNSLVMEDFDGDGLLDLAVARGGSHDIAFFLGDGRGDFAMGARIVVGNGPAALTAGDLEGDGDRDLAVANLASDSVSLVSRIPGRKATSHDCNRNGIPDDCELSGNDCNANGIPDDCDLMKAELRLSPIERIALQFPPMSLAGGDLDGDGDPDFAAQLENVDLASIIRNDGHDSFTSVGTLSLRFESGVVVQAGSITVADLDGDGLAEIAAILSYRESIEILKNQGGQFGPQLEYPAGTTPIALTVADVNGDGRPDLLVANIDASQVSVVIQASDGTFLPPQAYDVARRPGAMCIGDFNLDGDLDVAVACIDANSVEILRNEGNGLFLRGKNVPVLIPVSLTSADWDGDGQPDLAAGSSPSSLVVIQNTGNAFFKPKVTLPVLSTAPTFLDTADFDGDHDPDLIVCGGLLSIYVNEGKYLFSSPVAVEGRSGTRSAVVTDFDQDGDPDILAVPQETATLLGFVNLTSAAVSHDCNGNARPDECDISSGESTDQDGDGFPDECFLRVTSPSLFHRGDPNSDGKIDLSDAIHIFQFLFLGGPASACMDSADANGNGELDLSDGIFVLLYLFAQGSSAPPEPGPPGSPCGPDPTSPGSADKLDCEYYAPCFK